MVFSEPQKSLPTLLNTPPMRLTSVERRANELSNQHNQPTTSEPPPLRDVQIVLLLRNIKPPAKLITKNHSPNELHRVKTKFPDFAKKSCQTLPLTNNITAANQTLLRRELNFANRRFAEFATPR